MERQEFSELEGTGLLKEVEDVVIHSHRELYQAEGRTWSRPVAYQWLRYEDPAPVARLADGVRRLRKRGAKFDAEAVDKACARASKTGYLN